MGEQKTGGWGMALGLALALLLIGPERVSSAEFKVGVVDVQRALKDSKAGKAAMSSLTESGKDFQEQLQKKTLALTEKEEALKKLALEIQQKRLLYSEEVQRQKEEQLLRQQRDLQRLKEDVARYQKDAEGDYRLKERRLTGQILREIMDVVQRIGKQEKFTLIIERGQLLYSDGEKVDLTDRVIQEYDRSKR